jgi:hypothetical protein
MLADLAVLGLIATWALVFLGLTWLCDRVAG